MIGQWDQQNNLFPNLGNGTFVHVTATHMPAESDITVAVALADVDGDTDLVTANEVSADLSLFLGSGARTFPDPVSLPVLGEPRYVLMADLDTDGDLDLATADSVTNAVSVFRNRGDATFDEQVGLPLGLRPSSVISGDRLGHEVS